MISNIYITLNKYKYMIIDFTSKKLGLNELARKIRFSISDEHFFELNSLFNERDGRTLKDQLEDLIYSINNRSQGAGNTNFFPSNLNGKCQSFCLGVATKKFDHKREKDRNRTGFKGLIRELIAYWFTCNVNQKTIILTTDWDNEAFEDEWKAIIQAYKNNTRHEVEIYLIIEMTREAIQVF
jgi:hypothetical protein